MVFHWTLDKIAYCEKIVIVSPPLPSSPHSILLTHYHSVCRLQPPSPLLVIQRHHRIQNISTIFPVHSIIKRFIKWTRFEFFRLFFGNLFSNFVCACVFFSPYVRTIEINYRCHCHSAELTVQMRHLKQSILELNSYLETKRQQHPNCGK